MRIIFFTLVALLICFGCSKINKILDKNDDWVGEEIIEELIKEKLHVEIDLTPDSPEH